MLTGLIVSGVAAYDLAPSQQFSDWSAPANLGATINSSSNEYSPAISRDGRVLYFGSDRPGGFGGIDIWVARRASVRHPWGVPMNLGPHINTHVNDWFPNLSRDGHWMFLASNRPEGFGGLDIWVSWRADTRDDFGWQPPVNLGAGVNSAAAEASPYYLEKRGRWFPELFFSSNRPTGLGAFDNYVSAFASDHDGDHKDNDDHADDDSDGERHDRSFRPAALVFELSTPQVDGSPTLRADGLEIFFDSNRPDPLGTRDLWTSTRKTTLDAWSTPVNLGETVNSLFQDHHMAISFDGQTLFFGSNRPGGVGGLDLYLITRTKRREP
jgi:hypothetical protein